MEYLFDDKKIKITSIYGLSHLDSNLFADAILNIGKKSIKLVLNNPEQIQYLDQVVGFAMLGHGGIFQVEDENGTKYSLIKIKSLRHITNGIYMEFGAILKNRHQENEKIQFITNRLECIFYFNMHNYAYHIKKTHFKYKGDIEISIEVKERCEYYSLVSLIIKSKEKSSLEEYVINIDEMIYLFFGMLPDIYEIIYDVDGEKVTEYIDTYPNYSGNSGFGGETILCDISNKTINETTFENFRIRRNESYVSYDLFLSVLNSPYNERIVTSLVQVIEGIYKQIKKPTHDIKEKESLEYYMNKNNKEHSNITTNIFEDEQDDIENIIKKLVGLRNLLSHGFSSTKEETSYFDNNQYNHIIAQLALCYRVIFLDYVGVDFSQDKLKEIIYAEKFRYKSARKSA